MARTRTLPRPVPVEIPNGRRIVRVEADHDLVRLFLCRESHAPASLGSAIPLRSRTARVEVVVGEPCHGLADALERLTGPGPVAEVCHLDGGGVELRDRDHVLSLTPTSTGAGPAVLIVQRTADGKPALALDGLATVTLTRRIARSLSVEQRRLAEACDDGGRDRRPRR